VEGRKDETRQHKHLLIRAISGGGSIERKPEACLKKPDGEE